MLKDMSNTDELLPFNTANIKKEAVEVDDTSEIISAEEKIKEIDNAQEKNFDAKTKAQKEVEKQISGPKPRKKNLKCRFCDARYREKRRLEKHEKSHEPEEYICALCQRNFTHQRFLTNHYRQHTHEELATIGILYHCFKCDAGYKSKEECDNHEKEKNCDEKEKNHTCDTCGKAFSEKRHLKRHILTHSDEKPFVCAQCGKGFIFKRRLLKHEAIHTGNIEKMIRECDICGKTFHSSGGLSNHYNQKHSSVTYPCELCDKVFNGKQHLKQHYLIHTGERPHSCDICGKAFRCRNHLTAHSYTHTREKVEIHKPHLCDVCGKAFRQKKERNRHRKIHFRDNSLHEVQSNDNLNEGAPEVIVPDVLPLDVIIQMQTD